jgi:uncharacterized protein (TIGR02246 family)
MRTEEKIRQMIDEWASAVKDKDVDRLMTLYSPDVVVYDVPAPLQQKGADAHRENFEKWFASMPGRTTSAIRDLRIVAGETIAFAHCLNHISNAPPDGGTPVDNWVRVTACFERRDGEWKVTHEHISMPIDESGRGATNVKP